MAKNKNIIEDNLSKNKEEMLELIKNMSKEELLDIVHEFEYYPAVNQEDDEGTIRAYLEDESFPIAHSEVIDYINSKKGENMSTKTEKKDDSILVESIKVEANRWFDKTYGNTYHQARAIINGEYVVSQEALNYGGESHYETTILKDLIKAGVLNIGETNSLWRFCEENGIEYHTSHSDGLKRDLPFKDNHLYTDAKGLKFKIKSNEAFDEIVNAIEHNFKNESNISKALRICIEARLCDVKIPNLIDRVNTLYDSNLKETSYSMVQTSDAKALKEVVDAVKNKESMFDFSKEITLSRIYKECVNLNKDKLDTLKKLNVVGKSVELLEQRIENMKELIQKLDSKDSESSAQEDKPKTKKLR